MSVLLCQSVPKNKRFAHFQHNYSSAGDSLIVAFPKPRTKQRNPEKADRASAHISWARATVLTVMMKSSSSPVKQARDTHAPTHPPTCPAEGPSRTHEHTGSTYVNKIKQITPPHYTTHLPLQLHKDTGADRQG